MDRFVLEALVCEIAPRIVGQRARGVALWGPSSFVIPLSLENKAGLVVGLGAEAPGLHLGTPPLPLSKSKPPQRLAKLLTGSTLVSVRSERLDRIVHVEWRRSKPSGVELKLELILEWLGTRTAAYLIDGGSTEVLDLIAPGTPRWSPGQTFELPDPPPGTGPLAADVAEFLGRLEQAREKGLEGREAVRGAGGLIPLLADEVLYLHSERSIPIGEAFDEVRTRLRKSIPVLYHPPGSYRDRQVRYRLSPIRLEHLGDGEEFSTWNEGASAFIRLASRLSSARRRWQEIGAPLRKKVSKQRELVTKLEHDRAGWEDPGRLSRWGELLLAGLAQARRVDGGVDVPDPYHPSGEWVRVPLDPRLDLPGNAERYFKRSRKMKKGLEKIKARISVVKNELTYLETLELALENAAGLEDLEDLAEELRDAGILPSRGGEGRERSRTSTRLEPRRFVSSRGSVILAGRSALSNEELTFEIAHPEELWFHAAGSAGAHVVLRREQGEQVNQVEIEEAAGIAAYYSKSRGATSVEVVYTPRKHVRKIRGAPPGTVRLARYQSIRIRPASKQSISRRSMVDR